MRDGRHVPLVTVLMPAFNAGRFVSEAVQSILDQDLQDFELIIINDGSTDSSAEVFSQFVARDPRIRIIEQENRGFVASLNRGIGLAAAPIIARMDADDICLPGRLSAQLEHLYEHSEVVAVGGYIRIINEDGRFVRSKHYPLKAPEISRYMEHASPVAHPAVMYRADVVRRVGGYRAALFPADDYDLWLRLRDAGYEIENIPREVLAYRQHASSVSFRFRTQQAIAAAVASRASRMRRAGLLDPVDGPTPVSMDTLASMPAGIQPSPVEAFEIEHSSISRSSAEDVRQALAAFDRIEVRSSDKSSAGRFLIRASYGLLRNRCYGAALMVAAKSLWRSPGALITMNRF